MTNNAGAVLVTGASSGLGAAAAAALADAGFTVYAGVRSPHGADRFAQAGPRIRPVSLDVTSIDSVRAAARTVLVDTAEAGLHGLVNNAGTCVSLPLECLPLEELRAELEVNLVGMVAVIQQFLPLLRTGGPAGGPAGRIVNVSSGIGRVAPPFLGAYAASQFAKEGVSDVLRRELAGQSVSVSVIEPGAVMTPIWSKVTGTAQRLFAEAPEEVARLYRSGFLEFLAMNERRAQRSRTRPDAVARAVVRAMTAGRPRTRYQVGPDSRVAAVAARLIPDRAMDAAIRRQLAHRGPDDPVPTGAAVPVPARPDTPR